MLNAESKIHRNVCTQKTKINSVPKEKIAHAQAAQWAGSHAEEVRALPPTGTCWKCLMVPWGILRERKTLSISGCCTICQ